MELRKFIEGKITISRPMGYDNDYVSLTVQDESSRAEFLEVRISLVDFTKAITGQGHMPVRFTTKGLDVIGKTKEQKELVFSMGEDGITKNDKDIAEYHAQSYADEGWIASNYFGSQNSFFTKDGIRYARTTQFRYVEKK